MSLPWAAMLPADRIAAVARMRLIDGISALADGETVWLRGDRLDEPLDLQLRALPDAQRFSVLSDGRLVPSDHQVPTARLPNGRWQRLRDWLRPELPPAGYAGRIEAPVPLAVVRSTATREPGVLLASLVDWREYGIHAPQVRLDRWTFAVSREGRVVVRGAPLPPIRGETFVETDGIAIAAGWRCDPPVDARTLRALLGVGPRDVALIHADGTWERIAGENFVKATRSAIRASCSPPSEGGAGGSGEALQSVETVFP